MSATRFTDRAAQAMREEIAEAGGVEVFAIGDVDPMGRVSRLEVHCRGTEGAVPALVLRPRSGQVVIHNHPSGVLRPSQADFELAHRYGDEGIGVAIVNNDVSEDFWVVEPHVKRRVPVDRARLEAFFTVDLPKAMSGFEPRPGQLEMAHAIADQLDGGGVLVVEAGTGTGKSLAYLVPSVLWALANDSKVAVSTYTRTLQSQITSEDLRVMKRAGLVFEAALVKGRSNYLCRRKFGLARADPGSDAEALERVAEWVERAEEGSLQDYGEHLDPELWERLESDRDQTLRTRCPHYNQCFYYSARRRAASSHLLVLNHALLIADLHIKNQTDGDGVLPRYARVIVDEGHHLEDAATSVAGLGVTAAAVKRAVAPLLPRRRRPGSLQKLSDQFGTRDPSIPGLCTEAEDAAGQLRDEIQPALEHIGDLLLGQDPQRRIRAHGELRPALPAIRSIEERLRDVQGRLGAIAQRCEQLEVPLEKAQPLLDLGRASNRVGEKLDALDRFQEGSVGWCRWVEAGRRGRTRLALAPIDAGPLLRDVLFDRMEAVGVTSATLAVGGSFEHYLQRHGLDDEALTRLVDSPFSYREQALLALPRDVPRPDHPEWVPQVGRAMVRCLQASQGGAFVLCTSYRALSDFGEIIRAELGDRMPVLIQARTGRERLLRRFRETDGAILLGTDSFWEGVSVKGRALRQVLIPRLPFRVPTEPVSQARYEALERSGRDPFRAYALPEAVLKLRQGFGRLIRARTDRGAVVILDRRIHDMWYGRVFLRALPDAQRVTGPLEMVAQRLEGFFRGHEEVDHGG